MRDEIIKKFNSNNSYNSLDKIYEIEEINKLFREKNNNKLSKIIIYKENYDKGTEFEKKRLLFPIVYKPYYEEFRTTDKDLDQILKEDISEIGIIIENKEFVIKIPKRRNDPYEDNLEFRLKIPESAMLYDKNRKNNIFPDLKITEARPYKNLKDIVKYHDILKNNDKTLILYEIPFPFLNKLYNKEINILYSSRFYSPVQPYAREFVFGSIDYYARPIYFDLNNITQLVLSEIVGRTLTSALLLGFNDEKTILDFDKSYLDKLDISLKKEEFEDRLDTIFSYSIIRISYLGYIPSDLALYQLAFRGKIIPIDVVATDVLKIGKNDIKNSHVKDWILNPSVRYGIIGQLYDDLTGYGGSGKIISHLIEESDKRYLTYRKDQYNKHISDFVDDVIKKNRDQYNKLIKEYQNTEIISHLNDIIFYSIDAYLNTLAKI